MGMSGSILMDNIDLYDTYGVFAVRGSLDDLVKLPDMKEVSSYSWANEDGVDVYPVNRKTASRDITLTFLLSAVEIQQMFDLRDAFFAALKADGYRLFGFMALERAYWLLYKSCESAKFINAGKKRVEMVLKFQLNDEYPI